MTTSIAAPVLEHVIGQVGRLTVRLQITDVRLRGVLGDTVRVFASPEAFEGSVDVARTPGSLMLRAGRGLVLAGLRGRAKPTPDLLIEVPFGADVIVENGSGAIDATALAGVQRYRGVSGDVTLHDARGDVTADAISGDIEVTAHEPLSVHARTVSGDLRIRAADLVAVDAITTSGDILVAGRLAGAGSFAVTSVSGDTAIALTGDAVVEVRSAAGRIRADVEQTGGSGQTGRRTITFGRGGPSMRVQTLSGDVRLARPIAAPALEAPLALSPPLSPRPSSPMIEADRRSVLRALEDGEIDASEAGTRLDAIDAREAAASEGSLR